MGWTRRRYNRQIMLIGLLILLIGVLLAVGFGIKSLLTPKPLLINVPFPGSATGSVSDFQFEKQTADDLAARTTLLLQDERSGLLAQSYRLAGRFGEPPAERAAAFFAYDQILYGQYLIEQGRREDFQTWWRRFSAEFLMDDGLVRPEQGLSDDLTLNDGDFWRVNLSALRLLAQSSSVWPEKGRQSALQQLSDQLLRLGEQGLSANYQAAVPTAPPVLDPAATPTPKPTATPAVTEPLATIEVLRLSSIDLFAMQQLAQLDDRWQSLYERYLPIVRDGFISDNLPLYALGYIENAGYLTFSGDSPSVNTEEALLTLLHLCEVGEDNARSISWLRDQLFNRRAVYESYHIAQAHATSSVESVPAYAIIARIARIKEDADLYQAAVNRLLWHQATSQTSAARSAVFRQDTEGMIHVMASDNALALLALR